MFDHDRHGPTGDSAPRLARWIVDPATRTTIRETLDDTSQEFPRVNNGVVGMPYRFGYCSGAASESTDLFGSTIKHDMQTATSERRFHGDGREPGEPVFVARENATAEDDGWLMMFVYDRTRDSSDLVILDATDITGDEVARIELPQRVPNGFHGNWIADKT